MTTGVAKGYRITKEAADAVEEMLAKGGGSRNQIVDDAIRALAKARGVRVAEGEIDWRTTPRPKRRRK